MFRFFEMKSYVIEFLKKVKKVKYVDRISIWKVLLVIVYVYDIVLLIIYLLSGYNLYLYRGCIEIFFNKMLLYIMSLIFVLIIYNMCLYNKICLI